MIETLGLEKTASQEQVKQQYYRLAQKYHPDKNTSENAKKMFEEVKQAYETLGDINKRREYDQIHRARMDQQQGPGGMNNTNATDDYQDDFERQQKMDPVIVQTIVSFVESMNGVSKSISYERRNRCRSCLGSGLLSVSNKNKKYRVCVNCSGKGKVYLKRGSMRMQEQCGKCKGKGYQLCGQCDGDGTVKEQNQLDIQVPKGISDGQGIRIEAMGDIVINSEQDEEWVGDLIVKVKVDKDYRFSRKGLDIYSEQGISVSQAVLGDQVEVETVYGKEVIEVQAGTQSSQIYKVAGMGVVDVVTNVQGDHYVKFLIRIPQQLSSCQYELFQQLMQKEQKIPDYVNLRK